MNQDFTTRRRYQTQVCQVIVSRQVYTLQFVRRPILGFAELLILNKYA